MVVEVVPEVMHAMAQLQWVKKYHTFLEGWQWQNTLSRHGLAVMWLRVSGSQCCHAWVEDWGVPAASWRPGKAQCFVTITTTITITVAL